MNDTTKNAAAQSGITNLVTLDLQNALDGRRLCENGVGLLEETGTSTWQSPGAVDRSEWVSQIRTATTIVGPYQLQEGSHAELLGPAGDAQLPAPRLQRRRRPRRSLRAGRERPQRPRGAADGASVGPKRRSRSALRTTETLENAIARPASSGFSRPAAASGIAATL